MPPLGMSQMCDGNGNEARAGILSEKIKNILNKKGGSFNQFLTKEDETMLSANPDKPSKNEINGSADDKTPVNMCCDCSAPTGLRPCVSLPDTDCPFQETESVCFFKNLPPLTFAPYTQCRKCGRRFDNTEFRQHVSICCKICQLPPTRCEHRPILPTRIDPKYKPPFILKDIRTSCMDICDC